MKGEEEEDKNGKEEGEETLYDILYIIIHDLWYMIYDLIMCVCVYRDRPVFV